MWVELMDLTENQRWTAMDELVDAASRNPMGASYLRATTNAAYQKRNL